jgi:hypothetical protein
MQGLDRLCQPLGKPMSNFRPLTTVASSGYKRLFKKYSFVALVTIPRELKDRRIAATPALAGGQKS